MPTRAIPYLKVVLHLLCLLPLLYLGQQYRNGALANLADPTNYLTHFTGDWALWLLLADLAITPLRRLNPSLAWLIRLRRMVGLWAFCYGTLHLSIYVLLFSGYDLPTAWAGLHAGHLEEPWNQLKLIWPRMLDDVEKRPFIQVGLFAWVILFALAATSPQRMLRAMGGKSWQWLHSTIYFAGIAAIVHYWWLVKAGVRTPWKVTAVLAVLLLARVVYSVMKRSQKPRTATSTVV
jgi:methionine sulfoxide reductase heme-binding subunit